MRIIDLSRELYHRTPSYPGQPPIIHGVWKTHEEAFAESGNVHGNSVMYFSMPDHGGTHMDAPRHFGLSGMPINEYPLENCIVPGICIDLRHIKPRAEIAPAELQAAVTKGGVPIPKGGIYEYVNGIDEAEAIPGIEEVVITAKPGQQLMPLPEGASYLGFIFARGATPQEVESALREAHAKLAFGIQTTLDTFAPSS